MGALVDDISAWVWLLAGVVAVIGGIYGASKWFKAQFRHAVTDTVTPLLGPISADINHLHDCLEALGADAIANAKDAAAAANEARDAAADAKALVDQHTVDDNANFAMIQEWRDQTDLVLRNIQQAQTPHVPGVSQ